MTTEKKVQNQKGFTLVEIAIVLVIIGLLLGGVLKGQELIENAKVKNAVNSVNSIVSAIYGYQDRYNALPGDDGSTGNNAATRLAALQARGGSWANITATGDNNGLIAVTAAQTFTGAGEGTALWQHLRAAGFISGNPSDAGANSVPQNAFNGRIGFTNADINGGLLGNKICLGNVPGKHARAIDNQLDDGNGTTGRLRATLGANNVAPAAAVLDVTTPYNDDQVYTLCYQM